MPQIDPIREKTHKNIVFVVVCYSFYRFRANKKRSETMAENITVRLNLPLKGMS